MFVADTAIEHADRLTRDLTAIAGSDRSLTLLVGPGRPVLHFAHGGASVKASLCVTDDLRVDVSRSPKTVATALDEAARAFRADPNAWRSVAGRRLREEAARRWALDGPSDARAPLEAVVLAITHPALVRAIDAGFDATVDVPAWVARPLRTAALADVARSLFAPGHRTRPVVSSLGRVLSEPVEGDVAWWALAIAMAASAALEPDDVAALLDLRVPMPSHPEVDDLVALRALFALFGRLDARRLALEAASGPAALTELRAVARRTADIARIPLSERPCRLDDLVRLSRSFSRLPVTQEPARPPLPPTQPTPRDAQPDWQLARRAPEGGRPSARRFDQLRAALDGCAVGDLTLETPRSPRELQSWAATLDNCLAGFASAVRERRSLVVGVRRDGRLEAAFEIDPARNRLRQFHAHRNRRPPSETTSAVVDLLRSLGVTVDA